MKRFIPWFVLSMTLAGCGGGSSGGNDVVNKPQPIEPPVVAPDNFVANSIVTLNDSFDINQSVELFLYYPEDQLTQIQWQQSAGADVTFLADNSKAIAFTAPSAGQYTFEVSFRVNQGELQTLSQDISVAANNSPLSVRLGHAVLENNKVSLRTDLAAEIDPALLRWQQVSGPQASFSETNLDGDLVVFFDAPTVSKDSLLVFQASAVHNGVTYSDDVAVLVENSVAIAGNAYFEDRLARVFAYNLDSPYADSLVHCLYSNQLSSSCTLARLPLIAQESTSPTIDDIMDRVLVSHQWMGQRFRTFLETSDTNNDFKNLLRATTGIVISYDVRPSFYWVATGAIYLDANYFWATADERDTVNEAPDFRSDFGKELGFVMPWRYVKDNDYATRRIGASSRVDRPTSHSLYRLASLMYHELTHANDFFPSTEWFSHQSSSRILDAAQTSNFESDSLSIAYPLISDEMRALATVSFRGETANSQQRNFGPADIEPFFAQDQASDYYNYSSLREDYAMLFEELMMQVRYGVMRDVAITNQPQGEDIRANDYIVTWGQRGRVNDASVKPRVAYVAARVLPELDVAAQLATLPSPVLMQVGQDWIENLSISPDLNPSRSKMKTVQGAQPRYATKKLTDQWRYYQKPLPAK